MPGVMISRPKSLKHKRFKPLNTRELSKDISTRLQEIERFAKKKSRVQYMLDKLVHCDQIELPQKASVIKLLESSGKNVESIFSSFGSDVRMNFDPGKAEIPESRKLLEVAAIARSNVKQSNWSGRDQGKVGFGTPPGTQRYEKPRNRAMVFMIRMIIRGIERNDFRDGRSRKQKAGAAASACMDFKDTPGSNVIFIIARLCLQAVRIRRRAKRAGGQMAGGKIHD